MKCCFGNSPFKCFKRLPKDSKMETALLKVFISTPVGIDVDVLNETLIYKFLLRTIPLSLSFSKLYAFIYLGPCRHLSK